MDPRLYHYQQRTPRLLNPTFKSQHMRDSLQLFKSNQMIFPLSSTDKYTSSQISQNNSLYQSNPAMISKIRNIFQHNRSKVPLSSLSTYGRQVMFPAEMVKQNKEQSSCINQINPQILGNNNMVKIDRFMDRKQKNYLRHISRLNQQYNQHNHNNNSNTNLQPAGRASFKSNDKRYYRYKYDYEQQKQPNHNNNNNIHTHINNNNNIKNNKFMPSRLNYVDEMKGIIYATKQYN